MRLLLSLLCATAVLLAGACGQAPPGAESPRDIAPRLSVPGRSMNQRVIAAVEAMPAGGTYATNQAALAGLKRAIRSTPDGRLALNPAEAKPSFCSGATYLVLLTVLDGLNREGRLPLTPEVINALEMRSQGDGVGMWGRWNANGPGTARLFHELGMGRNFADWAEGSRGDFLKIFWTEHIGSSERGHSVIYWGTEGEPGKETVTFWSANIPDGYGMKTVEKSKIKRALFTRLEQPSAIAGIASFPARDEYLASMLKTASTERQMFRMVGMPQEQGSEMLPAAANPKARAPAPAVVRPASTPAGAVSVVVPAATPVVKKGFLQRAFGK